MTPITLTRRNGVRYPLIEIADQDDISAVALALEAHGITCEIIGDFLSDWARDQTAATRWVTIGRIALPETE